jgi:hypothetical protein
MEVETEVERGRAKKIKKHSLEFLDELLLFEFHETDGTDFFKENTNPK